jgi:hypothetical protein
MGTERAFRYVALLALHRALGFDGPTTDDSESDFDMPHPVDDDPVMASAIGRCSNQWTHAETRLAWIFSHLTKTDIAIAVTVFSFFKSTRTQRDVLKKLAKISPFMTNELRDRLTQALRTYCALAEGRNQLLHNPIGRSVENQVYIMLRSQTPVHGELPYQSKPISPSEIDELSTNIKNFVLDLRDLEDSIGKARFALPSS